MKLIKQLRSQGFKAQKVASTKSRIFLLIFFLFGSAVTQAKQLEYSHSLPGADIHANAISLTAVAVPAERPYEQQINNVILFGIKKEELKSGLLPSFTATLRVYIESPGIQPVVFD